MRPGLKACAVALAFFLASRLDASAVNSKLQSFESL